MQIKSKVRKKYRSKKLKTAYLDGDMTQKRVLRTIGVTIASRLAEVFKDVQMGWEEVSERSSIPLKELKDILAGRDVFTTEQAMKVAAILDIPVSKILGLESDS